jgi:hypothetical protein
VVAFRVFVTCISLPGFKLGSLTCACSSTVCARKVFLLIQGHEKHSNIHHYPQKNKKRENHHTLSRIFTYILGITCGITSATAELSPSRGRKQASKYRSANDEYSLLLLTNPLHDFVCGLRQRGSTRCSESYAIQFKQGRRPSERDARCALLVQNFQSCRFGMELGVEFGVE